MTDEERARAVRDRAPDLLDDLFVALDRQGHRRADVPCRRVRANMRPGQVERAVLEIRAQHFVACLEIERPGGDVHAGGRVRHEHQIVRIGPDVCTEGLTRLGEQALESPPEELDGPAFQLDLPLLVAREDVARARTERAMVEEHDAWVEQELVAKILERHASSRTRLRHPSARCLARSFFSRSERSCHLGGDA